MVTGGASGIGRATARLLAGEGASVVVADIDAAAADRVAAEVGGTAAVLDVADPAGWGRLVDRLGSGPGDGGTGDGGGGLDIAVLNAGVVTGEDRIAELGDAAYRRIMAVNVDGVVFGTRAVVPLLARRGVYALTKHAVVGFVRSVAPQLERDGIRINAVCPGITDTPLLAGVMRRQVEESGFPVMAPERVAAAVVQAVLDGGTGRALVCQPGRDPTVFRFPGVPGPVGDGVTGRRPPEDLRMDRTGG